jgi:hypothetical protein
MTTRENSIRSLKVQITWWLHKTKIVNDHKQRNIAILNKWQEKRKPFLTIIRNLEQQRKLIIKKRSNINYNNPEGNLLKTECERQIKDLKKQIKNVKVFELCNLDEKVKTHERIVMYHNKRLKSYHQKIRDAQREIQDLK